MPRIRIGVALCAALPITMTARDARAQIVHPPTVLDCDFQRLIVPAKADVDTTVWRIFHPANQLIALEPYFQESRWLAALDEVRASLERATVHVPSSPEANASITRFRIRQDSIRARVARLLSARTTTLFASDLQDVRRVGPSMFSARIEDGKAILFRGNPDSLVFTDADSQGLRRTICYHAAVERALLDRFTLGARAAAAAVLTAKRLRWESYFSRGYSQLPWELYINSRNARDAATLDPPTTQWIVFHPSVAVMVSGASYRDLARHDAIAIEPVGHIWYRNEYRDYFGLSGAVVFTNGVGTGVGPFLHFGRVAKVGYVFSTRHGDDDPAKRSGGALLSVDLYKFLSDRGTQVEGVMKSLRAKLDKP